MTRFGSVLAAAFLLAACLPAAADDCVAPRLVNSLAMEPVGSHGEVVVPVTLNGVEKKFLLDTGGGMANYLSPAVVKELNLAEFASGETMNLQGKATEAAVMVDDVRFGAVRAAHVRFQVSPITAYDGILSSGALTIEDPRAREWALMSDVDLDMDFGAMRLNFFSSDHCPGNVVYWPHQALAIVPVTLADGHIAFPAALDGHPIRATIDTGAPWTNLDAGWAEQRLNFSADAPAPPSTDLPKDDPGSGTYFRKYSSLSFEGVTIANPVMVVRRLQFTGRNDRVSLGSRAGHLFDAINRHDPDIIIGMEVLRHLHLYYAAKEQRLYITPALTLPVKDEVQPAK